MSFVLLFGGFGEERCVGDFVDVELSLWLC